IAHEDVAAVDVHFDENAGYAGFDEASPLARSRGKCDVLARWRARHGGRTMLVGDGATDAEAAGDVDVFVAYTGVARRPGVVDAADAVVHSASLVPVLPIALGGIPPLGATELKLFDRGVALLDPDMRRRLEYPNL